jgi:hypothetical protein
MKPEFVWVFNANHRVYRHDPVTGRGIGGPIWREHWVKYEVVGETSKSWVLIGGRKVPKSGADPQLFAFDQLQLEQQAYIHDNAMRISDRVARLRDYDTLNKIADLIGYRPDPPVTREAGK